MTKRQARVRTIQVCLLLLAAMVFLMWRGTHPVLTPFQACRPARETADYRRGACYEDCQRVLDPIAPHDRQTQEACFQGCWVPWRRQIVDSFPGCTIE